MVDQLDVECTDASKPMQTGINRSRRIVDDSRYRIVQYSSFLFFLIAIFLSPHCLTPLADTIQIANANLVLIFAVVQTRVEMIKYRYL